MKSKFTKVLMLGLVSVFVFTGCSAKRAMEQPDKKDMQVLKKGTPRYKIMAEFGQPIETNNLENGNISDTYSFIQGFSKEEKTARAVGHAVMDVATIGFWELIGTPVEVALSGEKIILKVLYDDKKTVKFYYSP